MKLARDTKDPSKIDGVDHGVIGIVVGVITYLIVTQYLGYKSPLLILIGAIFGVFIVFFIQEVIQEYGMRKKRRAYPFNPFKWSQNRHQDWVFPVIGCAIGWKVTEFVMRFI